ncbi:MAG: Na/Pi cotransporter family protein [Lachnospiraceae bacterium]|nr:Na/Pi cotransporter family protein [Lachnospiraceae bacterium]RKJ49158.1 Na/Pi cotransporter family protein [bacterium 1XD42-54]
MNLFEGGCREKFLLPCKVQMGIGSIISLAGGLGLFLFGMKYMGEGLELAAGPKMKDLLEKLTRNRIAGFLLGALVTVVIQSSSATTVMVMGFINAEIMDLAQATGVIFGANIGTTITSVLIALDVSGIAPVCICLGAAMLLYAKRKRNRYIGQVILGFGLLFQGLHTMSSAMSPLKDFAPFQNFIMNAKNPLLGFVVGVVLCAVIQSSSAAVGVLQALAMQGLMPLYFASFIICGINVGSSAPPLLSALNAKNNAKRAAIIYLIFNVVGAVLFVPISMLTPLTSLIETYVPGGVFQISVYHILFKVVTGVILLPLVNFVVKWTYMIVPKQAHESAFRLEYIDPDMPVGSPAVIALQVGKEVERMGSFVRDNLTKASEGLLTHDLMDANRIREGEEIVDYLASEITDYLTTINSLELPARVSQYMGCAFHVINDLEQIGDHAIKIMEQNEKCVEGGFIYSGAAKDELLEICDMDLKLLEGTMKLFREQSITPENWLALRKMERKIIKRVSKAQTNHMERLKNKECGFEQGLTFVEVLNSYLRIVNHTVNIEEACGSEVLVGLVKPEQDKN